MNKSNLAVCHFLVICLSLVFSSTGLLAATIVNSGTITTEATIYEDATGNNGGGYSNVCVGNQATLNTTRYSYVRYNLPAMPEGATLSRVQLTLFQESVRSTPGTDNGKSATLKLHLVTSSWSEGAGVGGSDSPCDGGENVSGIDWAGAPGNEPTESATEPLPGTVKLDPPPPPKIITIDTDSGTNDDQLINDILAWYADPGSNHGWRLSVEEEETDNARVLNPSSLTLTWTDATTDTFTIGGNVSGLSGTGLVLQNNAGDDLQIDANGSFTFATALGDGSDYIVTVLTQPTDLSQTCSVSSGSGTLTGGNVTNVVVSCSTDTFTIGGNVNGLAGSGLVLQNNTGDNLPITTDGGFTFATALNDGSDYSVTVLTQPSSPEQTCNVTNGSSTLAGANITNVVVSCSTDTFTIGGNVSGLTGTGLVLQNNTGDDLPITTNGSFTFATALDDGSDYTVTVLTQPTDLSQTCSISNGSGTLAGGSVTDVAVSCTTDTFTIGGTVSGLAGSGLVLQNNTGDDLPITTDGGFTFATALNDGNDYSVTVLTQPTAPNQTCSVSSGSGTLAGANVTTVVVNCTTETFTIGGNVSGLTGTGLVLQNNAGDDLPITTDGSFTFATALDDGSAYIVTVLTPPGSPDQNCNIASGSGTLAGANVTDVVVSCSTDTLTIGGTVSGLSGSGLVLQNNNGDNLPILVNGGFTFATALDDGSDYIVTVLTQPTNPNQTCNVSNGSGTLAGGNVTDVAVSCTTDTFTIGGNVSGLTGSGLVLQNNNGDNLPITTNGSFAFATAMDDGSDYSVTVLNQPTDPNQTCSVSSGSGTLAGANVTTVVVNCTNDTYTIGGNISGLSGTGLVLQNNDGDNLPITTNGSFTFATALDDGSDYSVTVLTQPGSPDQNCNISSGSATLAGANVTNVVVSCSTDTFTIGGTVSGLTGTGLVLQNNAGDDLPIVAGGSFTFATALDDDSAYSVTVLTQPNGPKQTCSVSDGSGTLAGADIIDVSVTCITKPENIFTDSFEE